MASPCLEPPARLPGARAGAGSFRVVSASGWLLCLCKLAPPARGLLSPQRQGEQRWRATLKMGLVLVQGLSSPRLSAWGRHAAGGVLSREIALELWLGWPRTRGPVG